MILSILICTIPERKALFEALKLQLAWELSDLFFPNADGMVEILSDDSTEAMIGAKRNLLLEQAKGQFIVFIDDDDWVSEDYIGLILSAIQQNPQVDCIGIKGWMTTNGVDKRDWEISKDFGSWYEKDQIYYRTPNHISPVRRAIALKVGFPEKDFGEDFDYSMGILPFLKTEAKIDKQIYHYRFASK